MLFIAILIENTGAYYVIIAVCGSNMVKAEKSAFNDLNLWGPVCLTILTAKQQQIGTTCKSMLCMKQSKVSSVNVNVISRIVYKHLQDQTTEVIIRASGVPLVI